MKNKRNPNKSVFLNEVKKLILLGALLLPFYSFTQLHFVRYDSIAVTENEILLANPWAGGLNSPQFSQIDLNNDMKKDLFIFERDWYGMVKTFLNNGTSNQVDYTHAPKYQRQFPAMHHWTLLADYNCDGREDIFTSVPAGIAVYRNDTESGESLRFTLVSSLLLSENSDGLYVSPPDIPALTDVDKDGDLDILSFGVLGNNVKYHKNLSMERYGNCDHLEFMQESGCWGYFSESSQDNSITLFDTCERSAVSNPDNRHAGSALLALDLNGNGLKDLLLGDISYKNLVMVSNTGSIDEASMSSVDYAFPSYSTPVDLRVFPAAFHLDVNNDNKKDLLISPNNPNTSENFNNIWYYENTGSESVPEFELQSTEFLQNQMIDVGEGSRPVFFDSNADGLLDIIIGNYGYFLGTANFDSKLTLLRNTGTANKPAFELADRDYAGLSALNINGVYPAFGDMDKDGDEDMIIGDEDGQLHLFINMAEPGSPASFVLTNPQYMGIDVGEASVPQIVDVNRDDKPDLLVGELSGNVNYFENTGTDVEAFFSDEPVSEYFGGINENYLYQYSSPFLTLDTLGEYLLYVGFENGYLHQFNNIEGNISGLFNQVDSLFLEGLRVNIHGDDLNNNGKTEIVYGEYAGGLAIMQNGIPDWIGIHESVNKDFRVELFPNPATNEVFLGFPQLQTGEHLQIHVVNIYGNVIRSFQTKYSGELVKMDLANLPEGIYMIQVLTKLRHTTKKLIVK